jgi:hypothetical protein
MCRSSAVACLTRVAAGRAAAPAAAFGATRAGTAVAADWRAQRRKDAVCLFRAPYLCPCGAGVCRSRHLRGWIVLRPHVSRVGRASGAVLGAHTSGTKSVGSSSDASGRAGTIRREPAAAAPRAGATRDDGCARASNGRRSRPKDQLQAWAGSYLEHCRHWPRRQGSRQPPDLARCFRGGGGGGFDRLLTSVTLRPAARAEHRMPHRRFPRAF